MKLCCSLLLPALFQHQMIEITKEKDDDDDDDEEQEEELCYY